MPDTPAAPPVSFAEFPATTTAEWQARLARDLKGQDPAVLRWPLPEPLAARLRSSAKADSGCASGCASCDHAEAKSKSGSSLAAPQRITFHPRKPR